jgi:hypothetical protein
MKKNFFVYIFFSIFILRRKKVFFCLQEMRDRFATSRRGHTWKCKSQMMGINGFDSSSVCICGFVDLECEKVQVFLLLLKNRVNPPLISERTQLRFSFFFRHVFHKKLL